MDTIYAPATARGKAGVCVVRISGPQARSGLTTLVGTFGRPRQAVLRALKNDGLVLDEALVLWFPEGSSFTGEETVELQLHGSVAILDAVLAYLRQLPGFRLAEPGEFTRRALHNGCIDLSQVEGLADLIAAETEAQRRQAIRVFSGEIGKTIEVWRGKLLRAIALIEATLDFPDEEVPVDVRPEVLDLIRHVQGSLEAQFQGYAAAERLRDGFEVAIVGPPNAGKSTLINHIAGRSVALTSEYPGTTRDILEVRFDLDGLPVLLLDTAGLREASDPIEAMGIERAIERARQADLRVFLSEDGRLPEIREIAYQEGDLVVRSKADLCKPAELAVSGKTGQGVSELLRRMADTLRDRMSGIGVIVRARHAEAAMGAFQHLGNTVELLSNGNAAEEIAATELYLAIEKLDCLVGQIGTEDVLGEIFSTFCIGK